MANAMSQRKDKAEDDRRSIQTVVDVARGSPDSSLANQANLGIVRFLSLVG
jgi:hypothetical protein